MKQAVILAAGEGRRLRPFTLNKPKAMIVIAGKPIIQYVIESLVSNGIRDIVLIVGYKREQIFDYFGDGKQFGVNIRYITQNKQLGTAQALNQAKGFTEEEFVVLPGDKLITPETLSEVVQNKPTAILVKQVEDPSRYGVVRLEKGQVIGITEKPSMPQSNIINTGIYIFKKDIFDYILTKLDIPDVINELLQNDISIPALETNQPWLDVVYPWDILDLNATILEKTPTIHNGTIEPGVTLKGHVSIGKGTTIRANSYIIGPTVIGNNCDIGPNVFVSASTSIADNVKIAPFNHIKNSMIGDNVNIGAGSDISDSIIDNGCSIGSHFYAYSEETEVNIDWHVYMIKMGAMIGESCQIGGGVVALPGVIVGNYCKIKPLKIINGTLADNSLVM
jgi:UDP-N-acetylglucosamine diphosphorylase / glucose-1-phosphate thymidylyltransferase / UDP-N-acetylgalactosamine diphosphorylase / glucosamine-1-phosphate N-acetyltransferase / galactosamine-1-phosphate N-acetyltransferase